MQIEKLSDTAEVFYLLSLGLTSFWEVILGVPPPSVKVCTYMYVWLVNGVNVLKAWKRLKKLLHSVILAQQEVADVCVTSSLYLLSSSRQCWRGWGVSQSPWLLFWCIILHLHYPKTIADQMLKYMTLSMSLQTL